MVWLNKLQKAMNDNRATPARNPTALKLQMPPISNMRYAMGAPTPRFTHTDTYMLWLPDSLLPSKRGPCPSIGASLIRRKPFNRSRILA